MTSKVSGLILTFMKKHRFNSYLIGFVAILFVSLVGMSLMRVAAHEIGRLNTVLRPTSYFFNYSEIKFVGQKDSSLVFTSTSYLKSDYAMSWNDVLRCDDGDGYRLYSVQNSAVAASKARLNYEARSWDYTSGYPKKSVCYLDSTITATIRGVDKVQHYVSEPFVIE